MYSSCYLGYCTRTNFTNQLPLKPPHARVKGWKVNTWHLDTKCIEAWHPCQRVWPQDLLLLPQRCPSTPRRCTPHPWHTIEQSSCCQGFLVFACIWKCGQRSRCTHTMRMRTCVSVVVSVARKLRPCTSCSGRRDRNHSVHWRSLHKGGGGYYHYTQSFCETT